MPSAAPSPILFFTAFPADGHIGPLLTIAASLTRRGYDTIYLGLPDLQDKVTEAGIEFLPMRETKGLTHADMVERNDRLQHLPKLEMGLQQVIELFFKTLPARARSLHQGLEDVKARYPEREIIILEDVLNMTTQSFFYDGPLPKGFSKRPKTIGISPSPLLVDSIDVGPPMMGLPFDSSESCRIRNAIISHVMVAGFMKPAVEAWAAALTEMGCTKQGSGHPMSAAYSSYDITVMLCSPSLEYNISDRPDMVRFAGCLPRREVSAKFEYPSWWAEVVESAKNKTKKVVFLSQGTIDKNWTHLVYPTIRALAHRDDLLVIVALGAVGDVLPDDFTVPANTRVMDYLPYDIILEHSDAFVSNGGYGAFGHAVMNGVPLVAGGETEDKPEVINRAEHAGFAFNMKKTDPSEETILAGVNAVLQDPKYKLKAVAFKKENEEMDCMSRMEQIILEVSQ